MSPSPHVFEIAPSGRSKCRGCGRTIAKASLRFGERLPNPFGDGDMTHWHHPLCAAHRRPDSLLAALDQYVEADDQMSKVDLSAAATITSKHHRLQRLGVLEQAPSSRARCRHCKELIEQSSWRVPLIFFNEDTYNPSGFIHLACVNDYCDTDVTWPTLCCFADPQTIDMTEAQFQEIQQASA